jgi:hypothetical protein
MPDRRLLLLWEGSRCSRILPEEKWGTGKLGRRSMAPSMLASTPKQELLGRTQQLGHAGRYAVHLHAAGLAAALGFQLMAAHHQP